MMRRRRAQSGQLSLKIYGADECGLVDRVGLGLGPLVNNFECATRRGVSVNAAWMVLRSAVNVER